MENNNKSGVSFFVSLLEKIDSWKKLGIFIVLLIFFGAGYFLYSYQKDLYFLVLDSYGMPEIDSKNIDSEAMLLIRETRAVSVVVWKVALVSNHREAIYININGQRDKDLEGSGDLLLRKNSDLTAAMIELLDNDITCFNGTDDSSVGKALAAAGVRYTCSVSVPPRYDAIVGVISLGFTNRPANEDYIRKRLLQAAEKITR